MIRAGGNLEADISDADVEDGLERLAAAQNRTRLVEEERERHDEPEQFPQPKDNDDLRRSEIASLNSTSIRLTGRHCFPT